ncbi:MAG TPA: TonB-dependent receptor [Steroidobacter sp.]|uniref:TonB-dependent receptor n=1 Tax=Steroidobacter sp. TaxID=1978227 RepID=UPI002ED827F6
MGSFATAATDEPRYDFDIPAQDLAQALERLAEQSGALTLFPFDVASAIRANPIRGSYTLPQALDELLKGTGLSGDVTEKRVINIKPNIAPRREGQGESMVEQRKQKKYGHLLGWLSTVLAASSVNAQNTPEASDLEEVVVTGIRESLQRSAEIKRQSDYAVDAITSEDIGKFPDNNVAEALQRIPGFAISRSNGEGQQVTVRGFGPEFNTVLWNGRRIATDANNRAFNFDSIPSDLLGGTEVYKTTNVALQEGGIGSTINLKTVRPSDRPGLNMVLSAKGLHDEQSGEQTPTAFGFISNTFKDGAIGAMLAAAYQQRKNINEYADIGTWIPEDVTASNLGIFADGQGNGPGQYFFPAKTTNTRIEEDRERIGLNGTLEFALSDAATLTVDAMYTKFDVDTAGMESAWFGNRGGAIQPGSVVVDGNNVVTRYNFTNGPEFLNLSTNRATETFSYGANLSWNITDNLRSSLDFSASNAKDNSGGNDSYFVIHGPDTILGYDNTRGYGFPIATDGAVLRYDPIIFPAGSPQLAAAPPVGSTWNRNNLAGYRTWWTTQQGTDVEDDIVEARFDNELELQFGWLDAIRFGAAYSDQEKTRQDVNAGDVGWSNYGATGIPVPASLLRTANDGDFLDGSGAPFTGNFVTFDRQAYLNYLLSPEALALRDRLNGLAPGTSANQLLPRGYSPIAQPGSGYSVEEKVWSIYAEMTLKGELGGIPTTVNIGARYSETDEAADSIQQQLTDILLAPGSGGTQYNAVYSTEFLPVVQSSKYHNFLPALNAKFELTPDLLLRVAYSKSLTRPPTGSLNPVVTFPATFRPGSLSASGGNANLKPYEADNFDVSLEWYFDRSTYVSAAYFRKKVDGLIANSVVPAQFTIANTDGIETSEISGNTATITLAQNINLGNLTVDGVELAAQHQLDWAPGLLQNVGFTAAATLPSSDAEFDRSSFSNNSAFPGLSNTYSASTYYDDGRFEVRVSWSRRDSYFDQLITVTEPQFVLAAQQWDARVAYNITNFCQIFVNGVNLTDEPFETQGRYDTQPLRYQESGPRYELGVRARF